MFPCQKLKMISGRCSRCAHSDAHLANYNGVPSSNDARNAESCNPVLWTLDEFRVTTLAVRNRLDSSFHRIVSCVYSRTVIAGTVPLGRPRLWVSRTTDLARSLYIQRRKDFGCTSVTPTAKHSEANGSDR